MVNLHIQISDKQKIKNINTIKLTCCFCLVFVFACTFNPNKRNPGAQYLQGQWQQDSINLDTGLVEYKKRQFKFTCDSFYLVLHNFSKAYFAGDTCYKNGRWTEFVKGVYSLSGDTIVLKGAYTSPVFKLKKSRCYTTGSFDERLIYQSNYDSVLVLKSAVAGKMVFKILNKQHQVCF
ncbi:MAG: hypothetical protein EAZ51_03950 [Sphingobacteriales bacterium]|nr:MAG: hypothetical protein EAZ64_03725 [Sphingobacteriales bacterium]TAF81532.1 MAG: hypothetical protein EAZ51_03950 [Sphingobacteriales bacterium]